MICCSCGKEIDINYGREYWNGIYCKKCADEMLSTPEYIKNYKRIIADLQAENAELRERLEKAVELPCRIGDTLYGVYNDKVVEYIVIGLNVLADWTLEIYLKTQNKKQNRFSTFSTSIGVRYFKDREAAEAKLAELKGEQQ